MRATHDSRSLRATKWILGVGHGNLGATDCHEKFALRSGALTIPRVGSVCLRDQAYGDSLQDWEIDGASAAAGIERKGQGLRVDPNRDGLSTRGSASG